MQYNRTIHQSEKHKTEIINPHTGKVLNMEEKVNYTSFRVYLSCCTSFIDHGGRYEKYTSVCVYLLCCISWRPRWKKMYSVLPCVPLCCASLAATTMEEKVYDIFFRVYLWCCTSLATTGLEWAGLSGACIMCDNQTTKTK